MKKKTVRWLCGLLTLVLTIGILTAGLQAGANGGTMDMDGDGAITIHDVQLAQEIKSAQRTPTSKQSAALSLYTATEIFDKIFGKVYTPTLTDGVYQISSVKDLYFVYDTASKGYSYKLTKDLDLDGMEWTPIDDFTGTFDGNGKKIHNFSIVKGAAGSKNKNILDQGFFSEIMADATVKNLNLENAEVIATEERTQFVGLLCGTNRGTITGCYTHGKITDLRENVTLSKGEGGRAVLAAIVARCVGDGTYSTVTNRVATEPTYEEDGKQTKYKWSKTKWQSSAGVSEKDIPIAAQLAVEVADRDDIQICLSHEKPASGTTQFQDISASWNVSDALKAKQDQVVRYMADMGTIKWTTPVELVWKQGSGMEVDGNVETDTWKVGTTQYGIPFNGYHSGLERMQSVADYDANTKTWTINAEKANEVKLGQTSAAAWYTSASWKDGDTDEDGNAVTSADVGYDGWIRYIGNDCSSAVSWAWLQISPVDAYVNAKYNIDGGGVFVDTCRHSFPYTELDLNNNSHYGHQHGLVQIGHYDFFETDDVTGEITKTFLDATTAEKTDCDGNGVLSYQLDSKYATTSANIWDWNANNSSTVDNVKYAKLYETYAQARKGDALQAWFTGDHSKNTFSEDKNNNGALDTYHEDTNANGKLDEGEDANGDGVLQVTEDANQNGKLDTALPGRVWEGHMRLLAEYPVAIRNCNGYFDLTRSYMITSEHGGVVGNRNTTRTYAHGNGVSGVKYNSWGLYQKYTFKDLGYTAGDFDGNGKGDCQNDHNSSRCYLPVTCRALREDTVKAQTYSYTTNPANSNMVDATAPYAGTVYTNYALATVTMNIYDANGTLVISEKIAALPEGGIRSTQNQYRFSNHRHKQLSLTEQFAHLKNDERLEAGSTYTFNLVLESVTDQYSNGTWTANSTITTDPLTFIHTPG